MIETCEHPRRKMDGPVCGACSVSNWHNSSTLQRETAECTCLACRGLSLFRQYPDRAEPLLRSTVGVLINAALAVNDARDRDSVEVELIARSQAASTWVDDDRVKELKSMRYDAYLASPEWQERRQEAKSRAGGRCQGCDTPDHLEVHHRTYEGLGREDPGDLTVLCAGCHTAVHLVADGRRGKERPQSRRARM